MTAVAEKPVRQELPVLLGLAELVRLFPSVTQQTVYRWRVKRGSAPPALPTPLITVSGTPMWTEGVIKEFAENRGLKLDAAELRKIRREQGR